jgi:hypothetical protein
MSPPENSRRKHQYVLQTGFQHGTGLVFRFSINMVTIGAVSPTIPDLTRDCFAVKFDGMPVALLSLELIRIGMLK